VPDPAVNLQVTRPLQLALADHSQRALATFRFHSTRDLTDPGGAAQTDARPVLDESCGSLVGGPSSVSTISIDGSLSFSFGLRSKRLTAFLSDPLSSLFALSLPHRLTSTLKTSFPVPFPPLFHRTHRTQDFWRGRVLADFPSPSSAPYMDHLVHLEPPGVASTSMVANTGDITTTRKPFFASKGSVGFFAGPLRFFSCPASSPEGLHCPRGSFIHAPFCRFHLHDHLGLDVSPSTIPDAGRGLFTLFGRVKGEHLIEYSGEVLSCLDVSKR